MRVRWLTLSYTGRSPNSASELLRKPNERGKPQIFSPRMDTNEHGWNGVQNRVYSRSSVIKNLVWKNWLGHNESPRGKTRARATTRDRVESRGGREWRGAGGA